MQEETLGSIATVFPEETDHAGKKDFPVCPSDQEPDLVDSRGAFRDARSRCYTTMTVVPFAN
jgi:hypothetical protein